MSSADQRRRNVGAALWCAFVLTASGCFGVQGYDGPPTGNFDGEQFLPVYGASPKGFGAFIGWQKTSQKEPWPEWVDAEPAPPPPAMSPSSGLRITFINHSTLLLQVDGLNILTDPIFSERASPVPWAGPRRVRAPGVRFDDLPHIDVVLISHNHYDHMDLPTLRRLAERDRPVLLAGLGNRAYLESEGVAGAVDLDWWQSVDLSSGVAAHFVPAAHFSGRGVSDTNMTLWGGFALETPAGLVYHAGDTGMGKHFAELRERFGPPRVAMLPIGAYTPRWFMGPVHIAPHEALQAHLILEAETSIGMHFGTFPLADEGIDTPARDLRDAMHVAGLAGETFVVMGFGEARELRATRR